MFVSFLIDSLANDPGQELDRLLAGFPSQLNTMRGRKAVFPWSYKTNTFKLSHFI